MLFLMRRNRGRKSEEGLLTAKEGLLTAKEGELTAEEGEGLLTAKKYHHSFSYSFRNFEPVMPLTQQHADIAEQNARDKNSTNDLKR